MSDFNDLETLKKVAWKRVDAIVPRFLMRPLSIRITRLLLKTEVTPTQVTLLSFALKLLAALLFLFSNYLLNITAGTLLYFSHVFDCVDGEVARVKNQVTRSGGLLDLFLDRLGDIGVYFSVTLSLFVSRNDPRMLILGMFVIVSDLFPRTTIGQQADASRKGADVEHSPAVGKGFKFGLSGKELILLVASVLDRLPEGMMVIGIVTFSYIVASFSAAYISLKRRERCGEPAMLW